MAIPGDQPSQLVLLSLHEQAQLADARLVDRHGPPTGLLVLLDRVAVAEEPDPEPVAGVDQRDDLRRRVLVALKPARGAVWCHELGTASRLDRKSTRLNSSHVSISYA